MVQNLGYGDSGVRIDPPQVARNIERVRKARQLKQKDVSERLRAVGRPILATVVSKIERGERRVDADDVMAFALAMNVSPLTLLLPRGGQQHNRAGHGGGCREGRPRVGVGTWGRDVAAALGESGSAEAGGVRATRAAAALRYTRAQPPGVRQRSSVAMCSEQWSSRRSPRTPRAWTTSSSAVCPSPGSPSRASATNWTAQR